MVVEVSDEALVREASGVLHRHHVGDRVFGDVACALVTDRGDHFTGVCIDTGSGTGFCAEAAAVAAMVTARQYRIQKIVAVWRSEAQVLHVLPPCGRCREFLRQVDPANLETLVVLGRDRRRALRDLLPAHAWPGSWSD